MPEPAKTHLYIFHPETKTVHEIKPETRVKDEVENYVCLTGQLIPKAQAVEITPDERLVLVPVAQLTDEELEQSLIVLHRTRLTSSDKPRSSGKSKGKYYDDASGLRIKVPTGDINDLLAQRVAEIEAEEAGEEE